MNIFLQFGVGLLPGVLFALILLLRRKAFRVKAILTLGSLILINGSLLVKGSSYKEKKEKIVAPLTSSDLLKFAYGLLQQESFSEVEEVIQQYSDLNGYDDECRLLNARMHLMKKKYEAANGLYKAILANSKLLPEDAEEAFFAEKKSLSQTSHIGTAAYLRELKLDPSAYGYTPELLEQEKKYQEIKFDDVKDDFYERIDKQYEVTEDVKEFAEAVSDLSGTFKEVASGETENSKTFEEEFEEIEKNKPELLEIDSVRKARLKSNVLEGKFAKVARDLRENSNYHELMIASELYMSDLIKESDFPKEYQPPEEKKIDIIKEQIRKIKDMVSKQNLSKKENKEMRNRIDSLQNKFEETTLLTLKEKLVEASEKKAGPDQTKVYLELAKVEEYFGNESESEHYMSKAIYSSPDCKDDEYVVAMQNIINVIDHDENLEDIKNISEYVDKVLDHSLSVDVEEIIHSNSKTDILEEETEEEKEEEEKKEDKEKTKKHLKRKKRGLKKTFRQKTVDYVSKVRTAVEIMNIDASAFQTVRAKVQIISGESDEAKLKQDLKVYDCGSEIKDFSLKKIQYNKSNITLLCDTSGSMEGSIGDLRDAVVSFVKDKEAVEDISIVTFHDSIYRRIDKVSSEAEARSFMDSVWANGGTAIYSSTIESLNEFVNMGEVNNVLIIMTDGQDGDGLEFSEKLRNIKELALKNGVTVYTLGLGADVETNYLDGFAKSGNGTFLYVSDSSSLSSFYENLHKQANSQYSIEYKAEDTLTQENRSLEVRLVSESKKDLEYYHLGGKEDRQPWSPEERLKAHNSRVNLRFESGLSVSNLSPKAIYKNGIVNDVKLKGTGFKKEDNISVRLLGKLEYPLQVKFVDDKTYLLTLPSTIAVGTYDVQVSINGKNKTFEKGFSVILQGEEKETEFGDYLFTSDKKIKLSGGGYRLSGNVIMNGWLHFKGDLDLKDGGKDSAYLLVSDQDGSYVSYSHEKAVGFAKYLGESGIDLEFPALGTFKLNQLKDYYEDNRLISVVIPNLIQLENIDVCIEPDRIKFKIEGGTFQLPYQKEMLSGYFSFSFFDYFKDNRFEASKDGIGFITKIEYPDKKKEESKNDKKSGTNFNMFNAPMKFLDSFEVEIDTLENKYKLGFEAEIPFLKDVSLQTELNWDGNLIPDSGKIGIEDEDNGLITLKTAVPITVEKLALGIANLNEAIEEKDWMKVQIEGIFSLSAYKLNAIVPGLVKYLGDISILKMPDTTVALKLSPFELGANAELMLLDKIRMAEAELKVGNFKHSDDLLRFHEETLAGIFLSLKTGLMWESENGEFKVDLSGKGELHAHSRFVGLALDGNLSYDVKWWILHFGDKFYAKTAFGMYTTPEDRLQFILTYKYHDGKKYKGKFYYIDENGLSSDENGELN